jgi:hypothetical protein
MRRGECALKMPFLLLALLAAKRKVRLPQVQLVQNAPQPVLHRGFVFDDEHALRHETAAYQFQQRYHAQPACHHQFTGCLLEWK